MADVATSAETKQEAGGEPKPALPSHLRDELILKFVGAATLVLGIVLLVSSSIAIAVLSIVNSRLDAWLPILPLSLLVTLVGGLVNVYFRRVIDRAMNPKKYEAPPRPQYAYPYPYQMPPAYYAPRVAAPGYPPSVAAPPRAPFPQAPALPARFCIMCGKRIPGEAKFCPYCRHAYTP